MSATNAITPNSFEEHMRKNCVRTISLSTVSYGYRVSTAALPPDLIAARVSFCLEQVPWDLVERELTKDEFTTIFTYIEKNRYQIETLVGEGSFFIKKWPLKGLLRTLLVDSFGEIHVLLKRKLSKFVKSELRGDLKYVNKACVVGQKALRALGVTPIRYKLIRRTGQREARPEIYRTCLNEEMIGQQFRDTPHVVHYFEVFYYKNQKPNDLRHKQGILMPFYSGGTLESMVSPIVKIDRKMLEILLGVTRGVKAISEAKVIHRDLKPDNIFFDVQSDGKVVPIVGDFGISVTEEDKSFCKSFPGPAGYASPEVRELHTAETGEEIQKASSLVSVQADIYSLGITFAEVTLGMESMCNKETWEINENFVSWEEPSKEESPWQHLVFSMSRLDPKVRPTIAAVETTIVEILKGMPEEEKESSQA
jgi:serine/threonine protein kinase